MGPSGGLLNGCARVVGPEAHRHRPLHHRADALAQLPGGGRPVVPDRRENPDHVGARHLRNRHLSDARDGVALQAAQPELRMLGGTPARPQLVPDLPGRVREGGRRLDAALLRQRIASLAGQLPVGERLLSGFLESGARFVRRWTQPRLPDGGLAVTIASSLTHVADEGRRESWDGGCAAKSM